MRSDRFSDIAIANRVQLIEDAAMLAWTGDIDYSILFDLLKYLEREVDYLPWNTALSNLDKIETFFHTSSSYGLFRVSGTEKYEMKFVKKKKLNKFIISGIHKKVTDADV